MAELADASDLGSDGQPCRFESCYPHQTQKGRRKPTLLSLLQDNILEPALSLQSRLEQVCVGRTDKSALIPPQTAGYKSCYPYQVWRGGICRPSKLGLPVMPDHILTERTFHMERNKNTSHRSWECIQISRADTQRKIYRSFLR